MLFKWFYVHVQSIRCGRVQDLWQWDCSKPVSCPEEMDVSPLPWPDTLNSAVALSTAVASQMMCAHTSSNFSYESDQNAGVPLYPVDIESCTPANIHKSNMQQ
jgi:hypothetical protein